MASFYPMANEKNKYTRAGPSAFNENGKLFSFSIHYTLCNTLILYTDYGSICNVIDVNIVWYNSSKNPATTNILNIYQIYSSSKV